MTIMALLLIIGSLWAVREVIVGLWVWKQRREYRHLHRVEVTQRFFGEARDALLSLVRTGKLDDKSATFRTLYHIDTYILRHPDAYPQISTVLQMALFDNNTHSASSAFVAESRQWTPEIRHVVMRHAAALGNVIISHSRILRWAHSLKKYFVGLLPSSWFPQEARQKAKVLIFRQEDKTTHDIRASQAKLYTLAGMAKAA